MICRSFEPIYTPQARILIVGSTPSVKSLEQAQHYAHPRNGFWRILFDIFSEPPTLDYERKKGAHTRAWAGAVGCGGDMRNERADLDSDMHDVVYNDFSTLYEVCTDIRTMAPCNGATADSLYLL